MGGGKKERQCLAVLGRTAVRYVKRIWKKRKNGQYTDEPELIRALVDSDDIHCLMIGASGVGKTAYFLYPNLEYTCASGMSFLALDSKGDLARNYLSLIHIYITTRKLTSTGETVTVCTTNASNFGETGPNSLSLYKTSSAQYFTAGSSVTLYGVKK